MNYKNLVMFIVSVAVVFSFTLYGADKAYADDDYYYYGSYQYHDANYHLDPYGSLEMHSWGELSEDSPISKKAAIGSNGVFENHCIECNGTKNVSFPWKLSCPDDPRYVSYNCIKYSTVYRNSKSITVWLSNALPGSVVKVKLGKKTYSKKVGTKKKIKIKIKRPKKCGSKVRIKIYYKGLLIGKMYEKDDEDDDDDYDDGDYSWSSEYGEINYDIVYYAKKIKKGMKKKQVKYLYYWGSPDSTSSHSGGWSVWYYDDGSYVGFKHGRVRYWYDAAR